MIYSRVYQVFLFCMLFSLPLRAEVVSFHFADTIKSNGTGSINLLKAANSRRDITPSVLEAFRQDGGGNLIFAVDVNEAASGSESADSQGVAIKSARLVVTFTSEAREYTEYKTITRTIIDPIGTDARAIFSTLIGTAGTDRISSHPDSELAGSSLDATLRIPVDIDLSLATSINLHIELLETEVSLGDPEAFYDFSNGYESIALLSREDADYLDALAAGRLSAPLVMTEDASGAGYSWMYYPSSQSYYVAAYEDLFPDKGDYDFNDLVVAYQVAVGVGSNAAVDIIQGNGFLVARGGVYNHDWRLRIEMPTGTSGTATVNFFPADSETPYSGYPKTVAVVDDIDLALVQSVDDYFYDGALPYVNTLVEQQVLKGPRFEFAVNLDNPVAQNKIGLAPFDPYLYVYDTQHEIHLVDKSPVLAYSNTTIQGLSGFRDESGFPFALLLPDYWEPPLAAVDIGLAYPEFIDFVGSSGVTSTDWFMRPMSDKVKALNFRHW